MPGWRSLVLLTAPELAEALNDFFVRSPYAERLPPFVWAELARYKLERSQADFVAAAESLRQTARELEERLVAWLAEDRTPLLEVARQGPTHPQSRSAIDQLADDMGLHGRFLQVTSALARQMEAVEVNVVNYHRHSQELTGRPGGLLEWDDEYIEQVEEQLRRETRRFKMRADTGAQLIENIRAQLELVTSHEQARSF